MTRRAAGDEGGQSLVEFALVLPVLMALLVGTIDIARGFQAYAALGNAARDAAREAAVHGSAAAVPWGPTANDARVTTSVRTRAVGLIANDIAVTSSWPTGNARGKEVVVTATYTFRPIATSVLGGITLNIATGTRARIVR